MATIRETVAVRKVEDRPNSAGASAVCKSVTAPQGMGNALAIGYGGCVLSNCVSAAVATVPEGFFLYTCSAIYLGPSSQKIDVQYDVEDVRSTRSFCTRKVDAWQDFKGKPRRTMTMTLDFHVKEPSMMIYSDPPIRQWEHYRDLKLWKEDLAERVESGDFPQNLVDKTQKIFPLFAKYFDQRFCPSGVSTQNLFGVYKSKKTTQDHLPITEKGNAYWVKSKVELRTHSEHVAAAAFLLDGAIAFMPMTFSHRFLDDSAAISSLDASLRFFNPSVNMNEWNLVEQFTEVADAGRSFSTARMYNTDGACIARMDQTSDAMWHAQRVPQVDWRLEWSPLGARQETLEAL